MESHAGKRIFVKTLVVTLQEMRAEVKKFRKVRYSGIACQVQDYAPCWHDDYPVLY
ncbi:hypothetical protein METHB2_540007 [Candidatus Methylobacter favarea]|uniref:Uncharacterized protein n=1 Tax=Candidatus Methylobacter favarea TaxID=2707345 RepID=A0A8S0WRC3_9GAMM|nr:hypothetical protein METHB2_540007 [Candidatus Methylobacter favarea]